MLQLAFHLLLKSHVVASIFSTEHGVKAALIALAASSDICVDVSSILLDFSLPMDNTSPDS